MADACCAHDEAGHDEADVDEESQGFWRLRELQAAVVSGVFLGIGLVAGAVDADGVSTAAFVVALAVGGWTFVPETLQALVRGRLGVGTLMTIAAVGR